MFISSYIYMQKKDLLKQLNNLQHEIKPDLVWKKTNREILCSQIKAQTSDLKNQKISWHALLAKQFMVSAYKPLGAMILIIGIGLGAYITTVGATRNSLPGDLLYGFKLTTERVQVGLANSDEKKVDLEIVFADRRLTEMQKLTENDKSDKNENLQVSLKKFQESMDNVKTGLAKLEKADSKTAAKLANKVDEKTKEYVDILKDQQTKTPEVAANDETATATAKAITASKSTADKALDVIVKEFEGGNKEIALQDLKQKMNSRIDELVTKIETDKANIEKVITNKAAAAKALAAKEAADKAAAEASAAKALEAKETVAAEAAAANESETETNTVTTEENKPANTNTNLNTNTNIVIEQPIPEVKPVETVPAEVLPTIEEIKDKPAAAEKLLAKAREFLASNSISQAFDMIKQADDIMTLVDKVIKANEEFLVAPAEVQPADVPAVKE